MTTRDDADLIDHEEEPALSTNATLPAIIAIKENDVEISCEPTANGHLGSSTPSTNGRIGSSTPVYYSAEGNVRVLHENVVQTSQDGRRKIVSPQTGREYREHVLKEKDLRFIKIFSAITILLFPPTGIIAFVCALRAEREFRSGEASGDLTLARKKTKTCERLILLTLILCLLMYVVIFAIVERVQVDDVGHRTFGHRMP